MKSIVFTVFSLFAVLTFLAVVSQGDWHLKRNKHNILPKGTLTKVKGQKYSDQANLIWILQLASMNIFHQPDKLPVESSEIAYPNVLPQLKYEPNSPNLKFLSPDGNGGSYEAILKPNGSYLITGKKQGTYNYSNPDGFWGFAGHILMDVVPHFFSYDYNHSLNKNDKKKSFE